MHQKAEFAAMETSLTEKRLHTQLASHTQEGIRRAANNTFGFIAKAVGPQDVLATLLNDLRVQERQSRMCTIVAEATRTLPRTMVRPWICSRIQTRSKQVCSLSLDLQVSTSMCLEPR